MDLITRSALPLKGLETQFAIGSTGFGTQSFYRHFSATYGHDQYSRDYLKLHAIVGTNTNVIVACNVTDRDTHDSPTLPALDAMTVENFDVVELSADKGYSSHRNIEALTNLGIAPFVAFTGNAKGNSKSVTWNKAVPLLPDESGRVPDALSLPFQRRIDVFRDEAQVRRHHPQPDGRGAAERTAAQGSVPQHCVRHP